MRTGDFSELLASSPNFDAVNGPSVDSQFSEPYCLIHAGVRNYVKNGQLYNPATCTPIPGNNIAAAGYSRRIRQLSITSTCIQLPRLQASPTTTWRTSRANTKYNTFDLRLDYTPSSKDVFFARFSYDNSTETKTPELVTLPSGFGSGANYVHARSYALGYTRTFSPNLLNQLLIGYNCDNYGYQPPFYGDALSAGLGIVNANRNQETSGGALIGGNAGIDYTGDYGLYAVPQNTIELNDAVEYTRGHHSFRFGATGILRNTEYFRPYLR